MISKGLSVNENPLDFLKRMTEVIEREKKDIAPEEKEFSDLTFAIANSCGEAGREWYKRICAQWSKGVNAPQLLDQKYDYALKNGRSGNGIGTVYHMFKQAGLTLPEVTVATQETDDISLNNYVEMENLKFNQNVEVEEVPRVELPHFDQNYEWPWPLNEILQEAESEEEHDILLLGAFTALGSTLVKKVSTIYGKKLYWPSLYCIVTSISGQGKSGVAPLKPFLMPIHKEVRAKSTNIPKMFIVAGNNTSAGLYANIVNNRGIGIIIESEADTLSSSLKGQYGNFSDVLRKGFDHESLSYNRKLENEYKESEPMALSLLICGTPVQIKTLVQSTENGLFNRIIYYYFQGIDKWVNKFNYELEETSNDKFFRLGEGWKKYYDALQGMEQVSLYLTEGQIEIFTDTMASLKAEAIKNHGDSMSAYVNRLAVTLLRMMTVTAFLRQKDEILEEPATGEKNLNPHIYIDDADFYAVLSMAKVIYTHATRVLSFLPEITISYNGSPERDKVLSLMPKVFTRKQFYDAATTLKIKEETAKQWILRLKKRNVIKQIAEATFQKL